MRRGDDLFGKNGIGPVAFLGSVHLGLGNALFKPGDDAIGKFAGLGEIARALGDFELGASGVELFLELLRPGKAFLFTLPALGQGARLVLKISKLAFEPGQTRLGALVGFLLERLAFDLQLDDAPVELVERLGLGIHLHPKPRSRFVDKVDGLVGQEPVGNVAVAERCGGDERRIRNAHTVVKLVLFLDASEDRDRILDRRLVDEDRLETPGQRRVLFDVLLVFVERGRTDTVEFTTRQRRLDEVGRIHGAVRFAGTNQSVHLVD